MNREKNSTIWTIPNILTLGRILLVPLFFALTIYYFKSRGGGHGNAFPYQYAAVLALILIILSDGLDGYIARKSNCCSPLGAVLDPTADKLFVVSSFALLGAFNVVPLWLVVIAVTKEVLISLGWLLLQVLDYDCTIKPSKLGRATLVFQFFVVLEAVIGGAKILKFSLWVVAGTLTVLSAAGYVRLGLLKASKGPQKSEGEALQ